MQSAEEITLDIFEKIWHKRLKLKEVERFQDWLFIVTKNELIARLRKKIVDDKVDRTNHIVSEDIYFPGKALEMQELTTLIEKGVEQLTRQQREIFQLSRKEGLSHVEIAEKLGLSRQTVKGHIVNALNFLRKFLRDNGEFIGFAIIVLLQLHRQFQPFNLF